MTSGERLSWTRKSCQLCSRATIWVSIISSTWPWSGIESISPKRRFSSTVTVSGKTVKLRIVLIIFFSSRHAQDDWQPWQHYDRGPSYGAVPIHRNSGHEWIRDEKLPYRRKAGASLQRICKQNQLFLAFFANLKFSFCRGESSKSCMSNSRRSVTSARGKFTCVTYTSSSSTCSKTTTKSKSLTLINLKIARGWHFRILAITKLTRQRLRRKQSWQTKPSRNPTWSYFSGRFWPENWRWSTSFGPASTLPSWRRFSPDRSTRSCSTFTNRGQRRWKYWRSKRTCFRIGRIRFDFVYEFSFQRIRKKSKKKFHRGQFHDFWGIFPVFLKNIFFGWFHEFLKIYHREFLARRDCVPGRLE